MSISTRSQFFYIDEITSSNKYVNFNEGSGELTATISLGKYTITDLLIEIAQQMTETGTQSYNLTFNRASRIPVISATSNFSILPVTGSNSDTSALSLVGFTTDQTGSNSYSGDTFCCNRYRPQFYLQDYVPTLNFRRSVSETINESTNGNIEVVKFGTVYYLECNIKYITEVSQVSSSVIENDSSALTNVRDFLDHVVEKGKVEFMEDRDSPSTFEDLLLEQTTDSRNGTSYKLIENRRLSGYYDTGLLRFRKL